MTEKPHIEFRNVTARYGNQIALDGLDFAIRKHTIFGIVGPANHVGRREIYRDRDGNPL